MATEICSILWKNCGALNSYSFALSFSLGLDSDWHNMVYQCKKLCKFSVLFKFLSQLGNMLSGF